MDRQVAIRNELLVLRAQAGDGEALAQLVDEWQPRIWAFARVRTGDDESAWEVTQEVWAAVLRDLRRLQAPERFRAWVFRIVQNKSTDRVRRLVRQRRLRRDFEETRKCGGSDGGDDIRDILGSLPEEDASLLALHYLEGFSYEELASIVGVPCGTVKSRLNTARGRLRRLLETEHGLL